MCAGPTPATLGDFWRLIWEEDSRTIVMLTNTQEKGQVCCESNLSVSLCFLVYFSDVCLSVLIHSSLSLLQTKCESYWPTECDRPVSYGPVEVTMTDVIRLADYTIRNFSIIKVRLIIHFQVMSPSINPCPHLQSGSRSLEIWP